MTTPLPPGPVATTTPAPVPPSERERSNLQKMSLETLLRMTSYLAKSDLLSLRLVSSDIERSLHHSFMREFFSKRQFMISTDSLQALIDMASEPRISDKLQTVVIGLDRYPVFGPRSRNQDQYDRFIIRTFDQKSLMATGAARDMLAEAFGKLANLHTVDVRDFNSSTGHRDGAAWRSYGAVTACVETGGLPLNPPASPCDTSSRVSSDWTGAVVSTVMAALAMAPRPRLTNFEINTRNGSCAHSPAWLLPRPMAPRLMPILANLHTVHVHVDLTYKFVFATRSELKPSNYFPLTEFLACLGSLKTLRLNFHPCDTRETDKFFDWLSNGPDEEMNHCVHHDARLPLPTFPAELECLEIGRVTVATARLLELVSRFQRTLRGISLRYVTLDRPPSSAPTKKRGDPITNHWSALFGKLRELPDLDLRSIHLSTIEQYDTGYPLHRVVLSPDASRRKNQGRESRVWNGIDFRAFLDELDVDMAAAWPRPSSDSEESSDGPEWNQAPEAMEEEYESPNSDNGDASENDPADVVDNPLLGNLFYGDHPVTMTLTLDMA